MVKYLYIKKENAMIHDLPINCLVAVIGGVCTCKCLVEHCSMGPSMPSLNKQIGVQGHANPCAIFTTVQQDEVTCKTFCETNAKGVIFGKCEPIV
jgi:hypothetical protein